MQNETNILEQQNNRETAEYKVGDSVEEQTEETMQKQYDAVALFSGGLDSILAAKLMEEQGLRVKCLHFVSPFFGKSRKVAEWCKLYNLDITTVDVGHDFVNMLKTSPHYGFGKTLNPCIDCKILMMRKAREMMAQYGASCIISGEVIGQRPMSQRRDTLNAISRDAEVRDILLRPLCGKCMEPTAAERSGLVDREKLLCISGRGRAAQMQLADHFGLTEIPTPGGGCKLTEKENARRYWPVLSRMEAPNARDFKLSNVGRQNWSKDEKRWLCIGRNQADNVSLQKLACSTDLIFKVVGYPGPISVGRQNADALWTPEEVADAASYVASFSPKAVKDGVAVNVRVRQGEESYEVNVLPTKETPMAWSDMDWVSAKEERKVMMPNKS